MLIWLLTLAGIFICYFISEKRKNPRKFFLISAGIVIVLILGSRLCMDGDEAAYNAVYRGYNSMSFDKFITTMWEERDFGFYLTYWCMAQIVPWAQFPIYFITALFTAVTFRFIYKNTNATLVPVLFMFAFGCFYFYMAAYRQCFAMCLCLLAFEFAKKRGVRGILPYAVLMFLASTMHISAVIFIPVYLLIRINDNSSGKLWWIVSLFSIAGVAGGIMTFASEIFEDDDLVDVLVFSTTGLLIQMILMATALIITLFRLCELGSKSRLQYSLMLLTTVGMLFLGLKYMYYTYERISYYYSMFAICAFSNAVCNINQRKGEKNFVLPTQLIVIILLSFLMIWRIPGEYKFFWQV